MQNLATRWMRILQLPAAAVGFINPTGQARRGERCPRRDAATQPVVPAAGFCRDFPQKGCCHRTEKRKRDTAIKTHPLSILSSSSSSSPVAAPPFPLPIGTRAAPSRPGRRAPPWTACTVRTPASPPRGPCRRRSGPPGRRT